MTEQELQEIKERHAKATPGPWRWDLSSQTHSAMLKTSHSGQYYVMGFERWGFQGATPIFQDYENFSGNDMRVRKSKGMFKAEQFKDPRKAYKPNYDCDIAHPDAQFIAHAPEDVRHLLEEVERLQKENNELKQQQETPA